MNLCGQVARLDLHAHAQMAGLDLRAHMAGLDLRAKAGGLYLCIRFACLDLRMRGNWPWVACLDLSAQALVTGLDLRALVAASLDLRAQVAGLDLHVQVAVLDLSAWGAGLESVAWI